jgi:hypothetical protein
MRELTTYDKNCKQINAKPDDPEFVVNIRFSRKISEVKIADCMLVGSYC